MATTTIDRVPGRRSRLSGARLPAATLAALLLLASGAVATVGFELAWSTPVAVALVVGAALLAGMAMAAGRPASAVAAEAAPEAEAVATLGKRLAEIEIRLAESERHGQGARAGMGELTAEIGLLGGLMKDIAEAVAGHDERLGAIAAREEGGALFQAVERRNDFAAALAEPLALAESPQPPAPVVCPPAYVEVVAVPPPVATPEAPRLVPVETADSDVTALDAVMVRDLARDEAIVGAIADHRAELHLQPVVALPQRKVRLYEALTRLRLAPDELLVPFEFLPIAERRGLAAGFDERTVARVLQVARHLARHGDASVMCNLSAVSIAEPGFLRCLLRLVETEADAVERLVLELPQRVFRALDAERSGGLAVLVERGVRLSMDRVQDLRIDPLMLFERGVRFVKVPSRMLLGEPGAGPAAKAAIHPSDLATMLGRAGIALVAERVETEAAVPDLLDMDVPLAQGFLFGPPRLVRPEVYTLGAIRTPEPVAADGQDEADRKPFRAFLRQAGGA